MEIHYLTYVIVSQKDKESQLAFIFFVLDQKHHHLFFSVDPDADTLSFSGAFGTRGEDLLPSSSGASGACNDGCCIF
jgi:hypothetical protein